MRLCVDAGGTHVRFGLVDESHHVLLKRKYPVGEFPGGNQGFIAATNQFLEERICRDNSSSIDHFVACVAGPVNNGVVQFRNTDWWISVEDMESNFSGTMHESMRAYLINDYEALAYGIATLEDDGYDTIFARNGTGDTSIVCGTGTGLGLSALKVHNGKLIVIPSEGGHQSFPVETAIERKIREFIMEDWVSYEHILSGQGLQLLFSFFCQESNAQYVNEQTPSQIIALSQSGNVAAKKALEEFSYALGGFCGNMVLALGATKGVYLWGGVLSSFPIEYLKNHTTRRFQQRGRAAGYVSNVPIYRITNDELALQGCSIFASEQTTT